MIDAPELLVQEHQVEHRAEQVDVEHPHHVVVESLAVDAERVEVKHRQPEEINQVEQDVQADVGNLQRGEFDGFVLAAQVGERNGREGIQGHCDIHHRHIFRMVAIAQQSGYLLAEEHHNHRCHKAHRAHHPEHRGIYLLTVHALLVHEPEERRLHAEGQHHDQNRHIGINVGDDAVFASCRGKFHGLYRHEQVVDKTGHDAAQAIDSGVFCQ